MEMSVHRVAVDHDDEYEVLTAALAENKDGTGVNLLLQASLLPFDQQDVDGGEDRYCVMTETGATEYGGVLSVHREANFVSFALASHLASTLGLDEDIHCQLEGVDEAAIEQFMEALRTVLSIAPESDRPTVVSV